MNISQYIEKYKNSSETFRASLWYTVCNVLTKGFALLSTPVFTRILSEEEYGSFSIFQSWFSILIIFTSLNIFLGGYTKGLILFKGKEDEYTLSSLAQTTFITLLFSGIYFVNIPFWTKFFELPPHLMAGLFIELLLMPALDFWASRKRFDYQYKQYVAITVSMTLLSLVSGVISVLLSNYRLEARVYSDVAAKAIFSGILFILILSNGKKIVLKKYWLYNFKFNIPLIPHYLSNYVLSQSDRIMIGKMVGNGEAGIYSVAYNISMMMNLIVNAINNAFTPYIYKSISEKETDGIKKATSPVFLFIAVLSIIIMSFAPEIIYIFAGEAYMDAIYIIPPVSASVFFIFLYAMFSNIEYYFQKTGWIALATSISAILNFVLNIIFIRIFGYYAAGYTTLICYIVLAFMHYIFYKKVMKSEMPEVKKIYDEKIILLSSILLLAAMLVMVLVYKLTLLRYSIIVVLIIGCIIKRKKIITAVQQFRK